ncbi:MAG: selenocysteine-specific translation elongation factor [Desulfobacterales bacterium]
MILGTAGHIDHGKTALVKALTGVETDRLKEEKRRGITIELGFASMDLASGRHLGIVDVPGHEKFVKNMVAGATGIDLVAMVIAADEGIMPQTREHLEICALLGIKYGVIVLSKVDLVDEEWLELVTDDIMEFTRGTFLEDAPVLPLSSTTGQGISEFVEALDTLCADIPQRPPSDLFRLPIDRVFTMKGFGTVITGTLISGRIKVGDTIALYPSGITSKVRGIQVHNESVDEAGTGMRTAINFQGLEITSANRGDIVSLPQILRPSYMVDASIHFLNSNKKPLKNRTRVRFHSGTSEVLGKLILLESEELLPGQDAVVQLRLDAPVALVKDDPFVIRSYSPIRAIGGGRILNPIPPKHKGFRPEVIEGLKRLAGAKPEKIIPFHVGGSGYQGQSFSDLRVMTNLPEKQLNASLQDLLSKQILIQVDKDNRIFIHGERLDQLKQEIAAILDGYHRDNPLKAGMSKEELKSKLPPNLSARLFNLSINQMIGDESIVQEEEWVRLAVHTVSLGIDQADVKTRIMDTYRASGLEPPYFKTLSQTLSIDAAQARAVLQLLTDEGRIIKVKEDLYFDAEAVETLKNQLVAFLETNEEIDTPRFKEMTAVSRKFVIPLIEYFDAQHVTIRIGDIRKLRKG